MIPKTFEEWKNCIVNDCKINLTSSFAKKRISIYEDGMHPETIRFVKLYGQNHLNNILYWYSRIQVSTLMTKNSPE